MIQNDKISEKMNTKMPVNETQRMHVVAKLTEKINFIKNEITAFEMNINLAEEHVRVLNETKVKRERLLENYSKRKAEIQAYKIVEQPSKPEPIEEKIPAKPEPVEEKKNTKIEIIEEKLAEKGFTLDDLLLSLDKKKIDSE